MSSVALFRNRTFTRLIVLLSLVFFAAGIPTGLDPGLRPRDKSPEPTPVDMNFIETYLKRPALHARLVYCSSTSVTNHSCGEPCDVLKDTEIDMAGGDDKAVPGFYVARDPTLQAVVVAHQGTKTDSFESIMNDLDVRHAKMDTKFFPNATDGVEVHEGFQRTHGRSAEGILLQVKKSLQSSGYKTVYCVGQSLGAAIALLDGVLFKMNFPADVKVLTVVFAMPRVGNKKFANMVDEMLPDLKIVTKGHDPVPLTPLTSLGYRRPSGELYVKEMDASGVPTMVSCPGQENDHCISGNWVLKPTFPDHVGPFFDGIKFGANSCTA